MPVTIKVSEETFTPRQQAVLTAALDLLVENGDGLTMTAVARRASCSKETLYKWFGDRDGLLTATVLGFAHTVGEFGVVLMIGGNIPGETRVLSVAVYDHVEATDFADAHRLSAGLVVFALLVLLALYRLNRTRPIGRFAR